MKFRILSYNIHKGIGGVDRRYCPERIVETIEHYSPDIALLQEVDEGVPRSESHCQVEMMALAMGVSASCFPAKCPAQIWALW